MKKILMLSVLFVSTTSFKSLYTDEYNPGNGNLYSALQSIGIRNPYILFSPLGGLFGMPILYLAEKEMLSKLRKNALQEAYAQSRDAEIAQWEHSKLGRGWFSNGPHYYKEADRLAEQTHEAWTLRKSLEDISKRKLLNRLLNLEKSGISKDALPNAHERALRFRNLSRDLEQLHEKGVDFAESVYHQ